MLSSEIKKELLDKFNNDPTAFNNIKNFKGKYYDSFIWSFFCHYHNAIIKKDNYNIQKYKKSIIWALEQP